MEARMKIAAAVLAMAVAASAAQAATVVNVRLGDATEAHTMRMSADKTTAKAGEVEFDVTNLSKSMVHEMIVVAVKSKMQKLPYDAKKDTVEEDKIADLGEASDLDPGTSKTLKLTLKPGLYRLICNQPGHYKAGMRVDFTVTK
jgi:uncharacterized cupredoxin-like copper-binding protein